MRRCHCLLMALLLTFCLSGCAPAQDPPASSANEPSSQTEESPKAALAGLKEAYLDSAALPVLDLEIESALTVEDRSFSLEDSADNEPELAVYCTWLADVTGNYDSARPYYCDALSGELDAAERNYAEGLGFASVTLHSLTTLPAGCLDQFEDGRIEKLRETVEGEKLTAFTLVEAEVSWTYTAAAEELIPQLPAGTYTRTYLVGRTDENASLKIWEISWGSFAPERVEG